MNRKWSALALSAVAMGAVAVSATEASAGPKDPAGSSGVVLVDPPNWPDEGSGYPGSGTATPEYNYPNYDPKYEVARVAPAPSASVASSSDDTAATVLQAGASALGGAGVAFGAMWLFRRHHRLAG
ncbi:hypothetical protein EV646_106452 [Kribbella antiqua]|uniref:MYXO-CTERM domain-containing protein n=1 Tax=Kribbella antiqua TaxID=2512217 RepID=A0A4R2IRC4_9ACTN|nr:hypothetical protein [Kribbella antiqua]TCO47212.1 hypothetical protein EV646_106452 [Kribbella antiqua]